MSEISELSHRDLSLSDVRAKENVSTKGRLLASYTDAEGKPQAGFRMEIPEFLAADHKLLNDYGYRMRRAHGKDTRKFIKFDEAAYSLILELKLPGDHTWLRISPGLARDLKKQYEQEDIKRLKNRLTARPVSESGSSSLSNPNWIPLGNKHHQSTRSQSGSSMPGPSHSVKNLHPHNGIQPPSGLQILAAPTLRVQEDTGNTRQTWRPSAK